MYFLPLPIPLGPATLLPSNAVPMSQSVGSGPGVGGTTRPYGQSGYGRGGRGTQVKYTSVARNHPAPQGKLFVS